MPKSRYPAVFLAAVALLIVAVVRAQDGASGQTPPAASGASPKYRLGAQPQAQAVPLSQRLQAVRRNVVDAHQQSHAVAPASGGMRGHVAHAGHQRSAGQTDHSHIRTVADRSPSSILVRRNGGSRLVIGPEPARKIEPRGAAAKSSPAKPEASKTEAKPAARAVEPKTLAKQPDSQRRDGPLAPIVTPKTIAPPPSARVARREPRNVAPAVASTKALAVATTPAIRVEVNGPPSLVVGRTSKYVVTATNAGSAPAEDVRISIAVPTWCQMAGASASAGLPQADAASGQLTWSVGRLEAGASETLSLELSAAQSRPVELAVRWASAPAIAQARLAVLEPKLALLVSGPSELTYGQTATYRVVVSNPGTGAAEDVVVQALRFGGGDAEATTRIGKLGPGERKSFDVEVTARRPGRQTFAANAAGFGGLRATSEQPVFVRQARLTASITGPQIKYAATPGEYTIRVTNAGDATARGTLLTAVVPPAVQILSGAGDARRDASTGKLVWTLRDLPPGGEKTITLGCLHKSAGSQVIQVESRSSDAQPASGSHTTIVQALADLKLVVNDPTGPIAVGQPASYEVRIMNRGTKAAESINVVAYFSEGLEPISVQGGQAQVSEGSVRLANIRSLAAGSEIVFKVIARATQPGGHNVHVQLECQDPPTKLSAQETTTFYGAAIAPQAPTATKPAAVDAEPSPSAGPFDGSRFGEAPNDSSQEDPEAPFAPPAQPQFDDGAPAPPAFDSAG